ncbi:hypothetical protein GYH30_031891 [Glycine max]|nr:hypothetical protein GYH30_031891 [Glycine max]
MEDSDNLHLEGFEWAFARVEMGCGAQEEGVVVEFVVFEVEVALPERGAMAKGVLATDGARGLEGVMGDEVEDLRDGVVCPWKG